MGVRPSRSGDAAARRGSARSTGRLPPGGTSMVILYKRLDSGRITLPAAVLAGDRSVRVVASELAMLLMGIARTQK
jgi:hypothetical protein